MANRRVLKGVLHNLIGTLVSRYSEHDGYWLPGFLVASAGTLKVDLSRAGDEAVATPPVRSFEIRARHDFLEQLTKAGLAAGDVREAELEVAVLPVEVDCQVNGVIVRGRLTRFRAWAICRAGRRYVAERVLRVAPHDPDIERRSGSRGSESGQAS